MKNITKTALAISVSAVMSGSVFAACSANIDMSNNKIKNLATPTATTEAANKGYVDSKLAEGGAAGTVRDIEGNEYVTIQTANGNWWMAQNLRTSKYPDNTDITHGTADWDASCVGLSTTATGQCASFLRGGADGEAVGSETDNAAAQVTNGYYYQWNAAIFWDKNTPNSQKALDADNQGVCMDGWHLPTDQEFSHLETWAGGDGSQNTVTGWRYTGVGTTLKDATKWNGVLAGYRTTSGAMALRSTNASFWSSSESGSSAFRRHLGTSATGVYRNAVSKANGFSVRCLKD